MHSFTLTASKIALG